jgi:hypothetical protein
MDPEKLVTIFAWPLAIVVSIIGLAIVFRKPITAFIGRITRLKYGNGAIETSPEGQKVAVEQQKAAPAPAQGQADTVPASHAMPPPIVIYESIEEGVRRTLASAKAPTDVEKAWLVRAIAVARINHAHEMTYRIIMGSQISLLLFANTNAPPDLQHARALYDQATVSFPELYTNFSFENWVQYPINVGLAGLDNAVPPSRIRITAIGQDFLHYLVSNGLTYPKYG